VVGLEEGFIEEWGQGGGGYTRWISGPIKRGLLGARTRGRSRRPIDAFRCPNCRHLELFAFQPD
jgi:hypothetical protein